MVQGRLAFLIRSIHLPSRVGQANAARQCRHLRTSLNEAFRVMHAPTSRRFVQVLRDCILYLFLVLLLLIRALADIVISAASVFSSPFATRTWNALDLGCIAAARRAAYGGPTPQCFGVPPKWTSRKRVDEEPRGGSASDASGGSLGHHH